MDQELIDLIHKLPKTELHIHVEGSFEPELMFKIAERNNITIPFEDVDAIRAAYKFNNLQEFLDIYYTGAQVLLLEKDFFDLTWAYLKKVHSQNVVHVEMFFDPQTHTHRDVPFENVINGIYGALTKAKNELGISFKLIMSYLRHLSEEDAFKTLEEALPFKDLIDGVGLDSSELGNPPSKFENVFKASAEHGFKLCAHAGEEGPATYIWEAIDLLNVIRIDHGNSCLDDDDLVNKLVEKQIPLTLCPLSNTALKVIDDMKEHPIIDMLDRGLLASIHSDDPAYFGGYMNENYLALAEALDLNSSQIKQLGINAFKSSWMDEERKTEMVKQIQQM